MSQTAHLKIKELPEGERPYEKLEKFGAGRLTDAELLAIIIRTGSRSETSISLAQRILQKEKIMPLINISLEELMTVKGVGRVKAIQIKAAVELGKRLVSFKKSDKVYIKTPQDVSDFLMEDMRHLKKEYVKGLLLTTKNELIKVVDISIGSLNSSIVHPREVFNEAVKCGCASIILVHNHPSGDAVPSGEDVSITKRIAEAGKILGIELLDHVIIGDKVFVSLKERNAF